MSILQHYVEQQVEVEISGGHYCSGKLIDLGQDIMVVFNENQFYYIPLVHVQNVRAISQASAESGNPDTEPAIDYESESLSYRKILFNAKGHFVKIYVSGVTLHGYVTSIMNDYFVFYSPVFKTVYVSMYHLKWLIPYSRDHTPYSLSIRSLPVQPAALSLSRTFEEQCKKLEGHVVVLDLGDHDQKTGLLQKAEKQMIELVNAEGEKVCWGLQHIKSVYIP